jgi:hypothetical protein
MPLPCPCDPKAFGDKVSGTAKGPRADEQKVEKKAQGKAIHEAVEAFIKAIDDNQCEGDCYPVFTNLHIGLTGGGYSTTEGGEVSVTALAEWRISISCKKPARKNTP